MSRGGASKWIVIPNWDRYQHYADRDPIWVKDYVSQLRDADYMELPFSLRGLLSNLRILYASSDGQVQKDAVRISRALNQRVLGSHLEALNDAGFIEFVDSKPLALARGRERSREKRREEKNGPASKNEERPPSQVPFEDSYEPDGIEVDPQSLAIAKTFLQKLRGEDADEESGDGELRNPFL